MRRGRRGQIPKRPLEWYDANEDELGDNANPVTLIDNVMFDPAPYAGFAVAIGAAVNGLLQLNRKGFDYTEEFEDFDFE